MSVGYAGWVRRVFYPPAVDDKFVSIGAFGEVHLNGPAGRGALHGELAGIPTVEAAGQEGVFGGCIKREGEGDVWFIIDGIYIAMEVGLCQQVIRIGHPIAIDDKLIPIFAGAERDDRDPAAIGAGHAEGGVLPVSKAGGEQYFAGIAMPF